MSILLRHLALLGFFAAPLAMAAGADVTPGGEQDLGEVVVEARRGELLQQMVKIEDRFYARYNELNANDDFDTHCNREARIGTRLERRYCRAVYMERALETEGHDHLEARKKMMSPVNPTLAEQPWAPPSPPAMEIEARRKEYQQNIREVVRQHPELVELLRERYELGKRYAAARLENSGQKPAAEGTDAGPAAPLPP